MALSGIPLPTQQEWYVVCSSCKAEWLSTLPLSELAALDAGAIRPHLYHRVSLVVKLLPVLSLLLFCFPGVGFALGVAGMIAGRRAGGWVFWASVVGVILTTVLWGGLFLRKAIIDLGWV